MTDSRFYDRAGPFTLADIAARIGAAPPDGAPAGMALSDVAALENAEAGDVSLFSDPKYANAFAVTRAGLVITSEKLAALPHAVPLLVVANPRLAFAQAGHIFHPPRALQPGGGLAEGMEIVSRCAVSEARNRRRSQFFQAIAPDFGAACGSLVQPRRHDRRRHPRGGSRWRPRAPREACHPASAAASRACRSTPRP